MSEGISIIIPTLNSQRTLKKCLTSIEKQNYPRVKLEVLVLDGGSTDETKNIAGEFKNINLKFIKAGFRDNMEARRQIGFQKAKFDLVAIVDSDNYLGGKNWLTRMEEPFRRHKQLVGSFTLHYHYEKDQTLFNRYVALFGGHDPVSYYLKKSDRLKWSVKKWNRFDQIDKVEKNYTIVKFNKVNFPTLGCNGFLIRKDFVHYNELSADEFFHSDFLFDLLDEGKTMYAVVDVPLTHDTGATILSNVKKRVEYMSLHHVKLIHLRRYKVFNERHPKDWLNLIKFAFFTITFIQPFYESLEGYFKEKDIAWFLHPIVCWYFLFGYGGALIRSKLLD